MEVISSTNEIQVGGSWGCYIACAGGCLISQGVMAMALAVMVMD